jgi:hypothetical protein
MDEPRLALRLAARLAGFAFFLALLFALDFLRADMDHPLFASGRASFYHPLRAGGRVSGASGC